MTRAWTLCLLLSAGCEATLNVRYDHAFEPGRTVAAEASLTRRID